MILLNFMFPFKYPVPQTEPPRSPRETLPTMYDLPSEDPEEPGLPDEFHDLQPQLLTLTFCPPQYPTSEIFCGSDINLYYDVSHSNWYKRPDWFGVVGVPRLYDRVEMRLSYVVWQEGINPFVVVELLSPGTEKEDLGEHQTENLSNGQRIRSKIESKPPSKWEVYEQILRIPYYVVFSRYTNQLRVFKLVGLHYQELELQDSRVWIADLDLGLGLWQGEYLGVDRLWLRWYDVKGDWILTEAEFQFQRAESECLRAEQAENQLESLLQKLRESGIDPNTFLNS
jgi:Uma2 family endonuclease